MSSTEARTYARALYETLIANAVEQLRQAGKTLDSGPVTADRIAKALPASVGPEVRNFLAVLANEGTIGQLASITDALEGFILSSGPQTVAAEVISAIPLSAAQQQRITTDLGQRYGDHLHINFSVDPEIIGGLIIRVGDQVLDNSIRTRLSAVQRNMIAS